MNESQPSKKGAGTIVDATNAKADVAINPIVTVSPDIDLLSSKKTKGDSETSEKGSRTVNMGKKNEYHQAVHVNTGDQKDTGDNRGMCCVL